MFMVYAEWMCSISRMHVGYRLYVVEQADLIAKWIGDDCLYDLAHGQWKCKQE